MEMAANGASTNMACDENVGSPGASAQPNGLEGSVGAPRSARGLPPSPSFAGSDAVDWTAFRTSCVEQKLVCYRITISNKTKMAEAFTELGLDTIGVVDDGVFAHVSKGYPMYGVLNSLRMENGWGRRVFFPESSIENLALFFVHKPTGSSDTCFYDTKTAADGYEYDFEMQRDYSLGCDDLVSAGVVWGLDGGYTTTIFRQRAAVSTSHVVEAYLEQFAGDCADETLPVFAILRKKVPGVVLPGGKVEEYAYTLVVPNDARGEETRRFFAETFDWEAHRIRIGAECKAGGRDAGLVSAREFKQLVTKDNVGTKLSAIYVGRDDPEVACRTILVWGLEAMPNKEEWTAYLWDEIKKAAAANGAELAGDEIQEEALAMTQGHNSKPYATILLKDGPSYELMFWQCISSFEAKFGRQIKLRQGETETSRKMRQAVRSGRAFPQPRAGAVPSGGMHWPALPGGGPAGAKEAAEMGAKLAAQQIKSDLKEFLSQHNAGVKQSVAEAMAPVNTKLTAVMNQLNAVTELCQMLHNQQLGPCSPPQGGGRHQEWIQQEMTALHDGHGQWSPSPGGQFVGGGASPGGVAQMVAGGGALPTGGARFAGGGASPEGVAQMMAGGGALPTGGARFAGGGASPEGVAQMVAGGGALPTGGARFAGGGATPGGATRLRGGGGSPGGGLQMGGSPGGMDMDEVAREGKRSANQMAGHGYEDGEDDELTDMIAKAQQAQQNLRVQAQQAKRGQALQAQQTMSQAMLPHQPPVKVVHLQTGEVRYAAQWEMAAANQQGFFSQEFARGNFEPV